MNGQKDEETSPKEYAWYCLRTQTKREHIASAILDNLDNVETFCPRIRQIKKTRTGKKRFLEAMFPGYLFAKFDFRENYRRVVHSQGVSRLVQQGDRRAIPEPVLRELMASVPNGIVDAPDPSIEPGAEVEMASGSLKGLNGKVIARLPAQHRVQVLLDFLGREITVDVSQDHVILSRETS